MNTNAAYLAEKLAGAGLDCYYQTVVGDNVEITVLNIDPPEGNIDRILEHWHAEGVDTLDKAKADSGRSGKTAGKAKSAGKDTSLDMDAYMEQVMSRAPVYKK